MRGCCRVSREVARARERRRSRSRTRGEGDGPPASIPGRREWDRDILFTAALPCVGRCGYRWDSTPPRCHSPAQGGVVAVKGRCWRIAGSGSAVFDRMWSRCCGRHGPGVERRTADKAEPGIHDRGLCCAAALARTAPRSSWQVDRCKVHMGGGIPPWRGPGTPAAPRSRSGFLPRRGAFGCSPQTRRRQPRDRPRKNWGAVLYLCRSWRGSRLWRSSGKGACCRLQDQR
jgi:hypothetical protein